MAADMCGIKSPYMHDDKSDIGFFCLSLYHWDCSTKKKGKYFSLSLNRLNKLNMIIALDEFLPPFKQTDIQFMIYP